MNKKLVSFVIFSLFIQLACAQVVFNKLVYGVDSINDYGASIQVFNDKFIVVGSRLNLQAGSDPSLLLLINSVGDTVWKREYDFANLGIDKLWRSVISLDGEIVVCGETKDTTGLKKDAMLMKVDTLGNTIWMKRYGGLSGNETGYGIKSTNDSGFIFTGLTTSNTNGYEDAFLFKVDSLGNIQWQKQYGGNNSDLIYSIDFTFDGGYILFGTTYSFGAGQQDFYLIKTDNSGNLIWQKTYGTTNGDIGLKAITTLDGGYIMVGACNITGNDQDALAVKTDSAGNIEWQRTYSKGLYDEFDDVRQFPDSSYAFVGNIRDTTINNTWTGWVIMTESNGDTIWTKQFLPDPVFANNTKNNYFYSMDITPFKGIVACGSAAIKGTVPAQNDYDVWVVKIDSLGCADVSCIVTNIVSYYNDKVEVELMPNPNNGNFIINYSLPQNTSGTLQIFDIMGKQVHKQVLPQWSIMQRLSLTTLPAGLYVAKVASSEWSSVVRFVRD